MPVTDEQFTQVETRVTRLERAQNDTTETLRWVVAKLGRVAAVQDEHTLRLERIEETQDKHSRALDDHTQVLADHTQVLNDHTRLLNEHSRTLAELKSQMDAMPRLVAESIREVLDERDRKRRG